MQRHSTADIRQPETGIRHPGFGMPRWALCILHSAFCIAALAANAARAATVYVATANAPVSPTAPYDSWETAATSLNDAVAYALGDGAGVVTEIVLTNGTHFTTGQMTINRALTIRGLGGREATIVDCGGKMCQFVLKNANAILSGLAIQNVDNAQNNGGSGYSGGGVQINANGGQVVDCIIRNNKHSYGGTGTGIYMASASALVSRCVITNNHRASTTRGGGIFATNGRIENCLIAGNTANYGTALCAATPVKVVNCTIDGTVIEERNMDPARGVYVNCVLLSPPTPSDTFFATNCAFTADVEGTVNSTVLARQNMGFADAALRLSDSSPLVNAGTAYDGIGALDLDGSPRVVGSAPDIGCWESQNATFTADFYADATSLLPGEAATFSASLQNLPAGAEPSFLWTFSAPGATTFTTNAAAPSVVFPEGGIYTVALEVSAGGDTAAASHRDYIFVYGDSVKVAPPSPDADPIPPYATWEHAATNIHDAIALQRNGATIELAAGVHSVTGSVALTTATTVSGIGGRDAVAVNAQGNATPFALGHALAIVEGLTISNAANKVNTDGIGVRISAGTLRDCRVCHNHNKMGGKGMGVFMSGDAARVERCVIDHNIDDSTGYGAGICAEKGVVDSCLVAFNTARSAGGIMLSQGALNTARSSAATLSTALVINCTVVSNASFGANCWSGGIVAHGGAIVNCLVAGNRHTYAVKPTPEDGYPDWNGYRSDGSDSEPMKASMTNCAFATGILAAGLSPVSATIGEMLSFGGDAICLPRRHSPCRNAGWLHGPEMRAATDLLGGRRVSGRTPDIGCHEIQESKCILTVR